MNRQTSLARLALRKALAERRRGKVDKSSPICVYDLLEECFGVEVKFQSIASMEGMYIKGEQPVILISSDPAVMIGWSGSGIQTQAKN